MQVLQLQKVASIAKCAYEKYKRKGIYIAYLITVKEGLDDSDFYLDVDGDLSYATAWWDETEGCEDQELIDELAKNDEKLLKEAATNVFKYYNGIRDIEIPQEVKEFLAKLSIKI